MSICHDQDHHFLPAPGESYNKLDGTQYKMGELLLPGHDNSVAYHILFCTRCAHTLEIITRDEHKLKKIDVKEKGIGSP